MRLKSINFVIALLIVMSLATFYGDESYSSLQGLKQELINVDAENKQIATEVTDLRRRVSNLKLNPHAIETEARNKHAYAKPDELVFFFEE